jgi:DNA-binding transcriptional regulator YiaG
MVVREATAERPYRYDLHGVSDVFLAGIAVKECPQCRLTKPFIRNISQLHGLMSQGLLLKQRHLTGEEIQFLRRSAGITGRTFARTIGVHPSHLSRVETEKKRLSPALDRLTRTVIAMHQDFALARKILLNLQPAIEQGVLLFELRKDQWRKVTCQQQGSVSAG